jgi:4-hydroxythreonine-4-phosphate dehydrogenase
VELELRAVDRDCRLGVVAVDTDSRHASPETAKTRVKEAIRRGAPKDVVVYKKIDSLGRGNVAAEVRATADALAAQHGPTIAVIAPAFPAMGRTTVNGAIHVSGVPLLKDGRSVRLAELLALEDFHVAEMPRPEGPKDVIAALERAQRDGQDAVVIDVETDAELAAIATGALASSVHAFLVGSAGLARHLAEAILGPDASRSRGTLTRTAYAGPALFVIGSRSATATRQRQALVAAGVHPVSVGDPAGAGLPQALRERLERAQDVVLFPHPDLPVHPARARDVARDLAAPVAAVIDAVGVLIATGGETARAVLEVSGIQRLRVVEELEPGLVASRSEERGLTIITKAGDFGDENMLIRCLPPHPTEEP